MLQFQVSPPKSDIENNVIISDYAQMDRILKASRNGYAPVASSKAGTLWSTD